MHFVSSFYNSGRPRHGVNESFITMLPKKKNPQMTSEYRPNSLMGSVYKIVSKLLANRLRNVIGEVVSES